jgi:hypothetical protein
MTPTVKLTIALVGVIAIGWFIFGLATITNLITPIPSGQVRWAIGIIAIACSIVTALAAWLLAKRNPVVYCSTVFLLGMILIVSFMDELGWTDAILIVITGIALGLLIKDRRWYLENLNTPDQSI